MKKLVAIAALLLATSAAQAQVTFEYGGRTIRVDPDRGTVSIPGVYDNSERRAKRSRNDQDSDRPRKNAPQQVKVDPRTPPAPVQIEQCGVNLCGYSMDAKSNQNGEQVLINMKPGKDSKWSGRILDPNTGSSYDSTIALKGPDGLRVQGCAFGGMFCGGQTWSRVN